MVDWLPSLALIASAFCAHGGYVGEACIWNFAYAVISGAACFGILAYGGSLTPGKFV